jgi:hypothetical protein
MGICGPVLVIDLLTVWTACQDIGKPVEYRADKLA